MSKTKPTPKPELADDEACARYAAVLKRRYRLTCAVEVQGVDGSLQGWRGGRGSMIRVEWLAPPAVLIDRGLTSHALVEQVLSTRKFASFTDHAGTQWCLHSNGGERGDEYGMIVVAWYPPDFDVDPVGVRTVKLTRAVEKMVRNATGRRVRLYDLRATGAAAEG